jgi:hypothetical protein
MGFPAVGIIARITSLLANINGITIDEAVADLVREFPERDPAGMKSTVRTQMRRQGAKKRQDEKRGLVFFLDKTEAA